MGVRDVLPQLCYHNDPLHSLWFCRKAFWNITSHQTSFLVVFVRKEIWHSNYVTTRRYDFLHMVATLMLCFDRQICLLLIQPLITVAST